jgi:rhamnosyltransferase subunit B
MCPEWFAMPQRDWPHQCQFAGFPFTPATALDAELTGFIQSRGAPLVFTPGTGVTDTREFFRVARAVCRALGAPGVFLSAQAGSEPEAPDILCRSFVDLGALLPHARLLVHHGGIGTTAQALRAGIPQVVMPKEFDQPDNAMRIAALRLGAVALSRRIHDRDLETLCRAALGDQILRERVAIAARDIGRHCAASRVASVAESMLRA